MTWFQVAADCLEIVTQWCFVNCQAVVFLYLFLSLTPFYSSVFFFCFKHPVWKHQSHLAGKSTEQRKYKGHIKMDEELNSEAKEWFLSWNAANGLVICVVYLKFIWWYLGTCTACSAISNQSLLCSWNINFHFCSSLHTLITTSYLYSI